jgi:transketolase
MRKEFARLLYNAMVANPDIYLVTADLGFRLWDDITRDFPDRFINTGAAEQLAMGMCIGLALEGKIPFFYSITPFAILRPLELIRTYIVYENIPVRIVGAGIDKDYGPDGVSHWACDIPGVLETLSLPYSTPKDREELVMDFSYMLRSLYPHCLLLRKGEIKD